MADKFLYPQTKKYDVHENRSLSSGAVITYNVPSYGTIDDILLSFGNSGAVAAVADVKSSIGKIAVNINGEQVINCTVERLYDFYKMLGNEVFQPATQTGVISLNLGRLLFKLPVNEDYFAWGCANIDTIQVQVYCNTLSNITDCELTTIRRSVSSKLGSYIKLISYPQAMAAAGISTVDTLPRDSNEGYLSVLASANGGTISQGECIVNGTNIFQPMSQAVNDYVVNNYGLSAVSGYFNYCFADGDIKGVLPMMGVTELRLKTTFTVAPTSGVYDLLACSIRNIPASMMAAINSEVA